MHTVYGHKFSTMCGSALQHGSKTVQYKLMFLQALEHAHVKLGSAASTDFRTLLYTPTLSCIVLKCVRDVLEASYNTVMPCTSIAAPIATEPLAPPHYCIEA
jgi:hypothetical protein